MNNKHVEEATLAGFTLLRNSTSVEAGSSHKNYKIYRCNTCSNENCFQPTHVRRKAVECKNCEEKGLSDIAKAVDLEIVGKSSKSTHRLYKFLSCNHTVELRTASVEGYTKDSRCPVCHENNIESEANFVGLTCLGDSERGGTYRRYRFIDCGHERDFQSPSLKRVKPVCRECIESDIKNQVSLFNLEYLTRDVCLDYRLFKLPCGCIKSIRKDHAISGNFACEVHSLTHYSEPSNIYLIHYKTEDFEWLKLGYAKNIERRRKAYGVDNSIPHSVLGIKPLSTGYQALSLEKSLHEKYKYARIPKEIMTKYHKFNGYSECYYPYVLDVLIQEINNV